MRTPEARDWGWVGLGAMGTVLVLWATSRYGAGYNPDAVTALATARNLLEEGVFFSHFSLYVRWPPLFPALQAGLGTVGVAPMEAARWINALSYGLLVAGLGRILFETTRSRAGYVLGIASAFFAFPLFRQSVEASTEPLFAVLVLLFVGQGSRYLKRPKWKQVGLLSACAALACLQRYAGVALLVSGGGLLLVRQSIASSRWRFPSATAWKQAAFFVGGAVAPLGAWLLRNVVASGTLTGPRFTVEHTLVESLGALGVALSSWIIPVPLSMLVRGGVAFAVVSLLTYGVMHNAATEDKRGECREWGWTCGLVLGGYVLLITVTGAIGASELPSRRLLMPVFAPALLLGTWGIDSVYEALYNAGRSWSYGGVLLGHGGWVLGMALLTGIYAWGRADIGGGGYNTESWQTSGTAEWVRQHRPDKPVRSNEEHALYFLTSVPQRQPESEGIPRSITSFSFQYPAEGYYVACFNRPERARLHPKLFVQKLGVLVPTVSRFADAVPALPKRHSKRKDCSTLVAPTANVDTVRTLSDGAIYNVSAVPEEADGRRPESAFRP